MKKKQEKKNTENAICTGDELICIMYRGGEIPLSGPMQWYGGRAYASYVDNMCFVSLSLRIVREYSSKSIFLISWMFMLFSLFLILSSAEK